MMRGSEATAPRRKEGAQRPTNRREDILLPQEAYKPEVEVIQRSPEL